MEREYYEDDGLYYKLKCTRCLNGSLAIEFDKILGRYIYKCILCGKEEGYNDTRST
jgi:hypothetical protein